MVATKRSLRPGTRSGMRWGTLMLCGLLLSGCARGTPGDESALAAAREAHAESDYPAAREAYQRALDLDAGSLAARRGLAEVMEAQQDWSGAFAQYSALAAADPADTAARFKLGRLLLIKRDAQALTSLLEELSRTAPDSTERALLAAGLLELQDSAGRGLAAARRVLEAHPADPEAAIMVASLAMRGGEEEEALRVLRGAAERHPDNLVLKSLILRIYQQRRDQAQAQSVLEALAKAQPKALAHRLQLARLQESRGQPAAALATLEAAVTVLAPPHSSAIPARLALVDAVRRLQGEAAALARLRALIEEDPDARELRMSLARLHELQRDPGAAITVYEEILAREPGRQTPAALTVLTRLAAARAMNGDRAAAEPLLAEVLAHDPAAFEALLLRGALRLDQDDADAAEADFRAALRARPGSTRAIRSLARALVAEGEEDEAQTVLASAIADTPRAFELRGELARLQLARQDLAGAIETLEAALKLAPANRQALEGLFRIRMYQHAWTEAHEISARLKQALPEAPLGFYYDGLVYQAEGQPAASLAQFESALALAPDAVQPLSQLIRSHLALGKPEQAERRVAEALEHNPRNFVAHNLKGELLLAKHEPAAAAAAFTRALELNPAIDVFYRNLAAAQLAGQQEDAAIATLERGIEATRGSALLVTALAAQFEASGRLEEAIAAYEKILAEAPSSDLALNNLAMLLAEYGSSEADRIRADELARRISSRQQPAYLDTMGWAAHRVGESKRAVELLEQAAAGLPEAPVVHYHLGMAQLAAGNKVQARDSLSRALQGGTDFRGREAARAALDDLEREP